jgi:nicotinate-nucleotide adenylyltransferase
MERVVIFGGSFDPPTKAHLGVIHALADRFDRVIVVPSRISPFKIGADALDGKTRIDLLRSCGLDANVSVSDCEINAEGVSYSYLTVEKYKAKYPDLYFCVGTDMLYSLDKWKNAEYLAKNVIFYIVKRPFYDVSELLIKRLTDFGFKFEFSDFVGEEGSSSEVKIAVAFDKVSSVAPQPVADYIEDNSLYRTYCPITDLYAKYGLKETRIQHTYRVAKASVVLAGIYGEDASKTIRAALWHDIAKYVSISQAQNLGLILPQEAYSCPQPVLHSFLGEAIARYEGEKDENVLAAIRNHTCARAGMSKLEMIVYLADMVEEGRDFAGVDIIRAAAKESLTKGMEVALTHVIEHLKSSGKEIYPPTLEAYEYYRNN